MYKLCIFYTSSIASLWEEQGDTKGVFEVWFSFIVRYLSPREGSADYEV